jgi:hypothetical protein
VADEIARPVDDFLLANGEQQIELLGKERIVIIQIQTKERKGFDKRTAPNHHLRPPA